MAATITSMTTGAPVVMNILNDAFAGFTVDLPFMPSAVIAISASAGVSYRSFWTAAGSFNVLDGIISDDTVTVTEDLNNNTRTIALAASGAPADTICTIILFP